MLEDIYEEWLICIFLLVALMFPFVLSFKILGWIVAMKTVGLIGCVAWLYITVSLIIRVMKEIEDYNNRHSDYEDYLKVRRKIVKDYDEIKNRRDCPL